MVYGCGKISIYIQHLRSGKQNTLDLFINHFIQKNNNSSRSRLALNDTPI